MLVPVCLDAVLVPDSFIWLSISIYGNLLCNMHCPTQLSFWSCWDGGCTYMSSFEYNCVISTVFVAKVQHAEKWFPRPVDVSMGRDLQLQQQLC